MRARSRSRVRSRLPPRQTPWPFLTPALSFPTLPGKHGVNKQIPQHQPSKDIKKLHIPLSRSGCAATPSNAANRPTHLSQHLEYSPFPRISPTSAADNQLLMARLGLCGYTSCLTIIPYRARVRGGHHPAAATLTGVPPVS